MKLLEIRGLEVRYGGIRAVRGIDLEVAQGELVCLIGANGAGKSSTLRAIAGMTPPAAGSIRFGDLDVTRLPAFRRARSGLVMVPEVEPYHRAFADALRGKYGRIPTAGIPRITRFRAGQSRFTVVDPSGNSVIYIRHDEPDVEYSGKPGEKRSGLAKAIETAAVLRDFKEDDTAAAKVLDVALAKHMSADPVERARALAARAELALAMGDADRARALRDELRRIPLSEDDHRAYREELQAAEALERWRQ